MNGDALLRGAAVALAAALLVAPYWQTVAKWAARGLEAAKEKSGILIRVAAAVLILAAAWGKVPLPTLPTAPGVVAYPVVATPSEEMKSAVSGVVGVFKSAPVGDRLLWSQVWAKAAVVVEGDAVLTETVFTDTRALRGFVVLALDIGWRRIGGNQPGKYAGLREGVESAFAGVIGTDDVPVTPELRKRFSDLCRALAWAALPPQG